MHLLLESKSALKHFSTILKDPSDPGHKGNDTDNKYNAIADLRHFKSLCYVEKVRPRDLHIIFLPHVLGFCQCSDLSLKILKAKNEFSSDSKTAQKMIKKC